MSDEQDKLKLSLEPPKLFGRKKKPAASARKAAPEPAAKAQPEPAEEPAPAAEAAPAAQAEPFPEAEPTRPIEAVEPEQAVVEPEPTTEPAPAAEERPSRTAALKAAAAKAATRTLPRKPVEVKPAPVSDADLEDAEIAAAAEKPLLSAYQAAALTGVAVGAAMVVLTWLSLRGCEAVRGTSSCGGGPGFLLLVATFVVSVLLGSALLRTFSIPDPGSTSFLAVGLVAVVALLFLIEVLDHWSMVVVIPVVAVGAYLASVWVTRTFVEPGDPRP